MRAILAACVTTLSVACGGTVDDGGDDTPGGNDACVGLECNVKQCEQMGKQPTALKGTVFAPNGTLPLYGIDVYVPRDQPAPLGDGLACDRCGTSIPGAVATAKSDEMGNFTLTNVPGGANVPLVIQTGKWRRVVTIANVADCQDNIIAPTETRLPKNKAEGDIPKIAITTGSADALECLMRKLGVDDAEMTNSGGAGRIHLFNGNGANQIAGGGAMTSANALWDSFDSLKNYDITIFSCEGQQRSSAKSQNAMDAVKMYADMGGRVFMSHWHNIWIEGATTPQGPQRPAVWTGIATWNNSSTTFDNPPDVIDEAGFGKGPSFATWMQNVGGSPGMRGQIPIEANTGKQTALDVDRAKGERWVYWPQGNQQFVQNFQFTTPNEAQADQRCGKVVFSDMHVSGDSQSSQGTPFPGDCSANPLTPQEKALAFMFFDIASCVGGIF